MKYLIKIIKYVFVGNYKQKAIKLFVFYNCLMALLFTVLWIWPILFTHNLLLAMEVCIVIYSVTFAYLKPFGDDPK
jgi:hypothetical protein